MNEHFFSSIVVLYRPICGRVAPRVLRIASGSTLCSPAFQPLLFFHSGQTIIPPSFIHIEFSDHVLGHRNGLCASPPRVRRKGPGREGFGQSTTTAIYKSRTTRINRRGPILLDIHRGTASFKTTSYYQSPSRGTPFIACPCCYRPTFFFHLNSISNPN